MKKQLLSSSSLRHTSIKMDESGRSMVEMLAVLGVMGVLSIIGVAGYSRAIVAHRANTAIETAQREAAIIAGDIATSQKVEPESAPILRSSTGYEVAVKDVSGGTADITHTTPFFAVEVGGGNGQPVQRDVAKSVVERAEDDWKNVHAIGVINNDGNSRTITWLTSAGTGEHGFEAEVPESTKTVVLMVVYASDLSPRPSGLLTEFDVTPGDDDTTCPAGTDINYSGGAAKTLDNGDVCNCPEDTSWDEHESVCKAPEGCNCDSSEFCGIDQQCYSCDTEEWVDVENPDDVTCGWRDTIQHDGVYTSIPSCGENGGFRGEDAQCHSIDDNTPYPWSSSGLQGTGEYWYAYCGDRSGNVCSGCREIRQIIDINAGYDAPACVRTPVSGETFLDINGYNRTCGDSNGYEISSYSEIECRACGRDVVHGYSSTTCEPPCDQDYNRDKYGDCRSIHEPLYYVDDESVCPPERMVNGWDDNEYAYRCVCVTDCDS